LRDDIGRFEQAGAQVVTVAPESADGVARFVGERDFPFPLLADPEHRVFDAYDVASTMMSLGQRPAVFVVDTTGVVRFDSVGTQQWQIPGDDKVLGVVSSLGSST
jgi:peroxiredoxin Q/BCP